MHRARPIPFVEITAKTKLAGLCPAQTSRSYRAVVGQATVWKRRKDDSEFEKRFEEAQWSGALLLEAEAIRRAREGLLRKKFTKDGKPIIDPETGQQYVEQEYSEILLLALLRRHFPDQYREKSADLTVSNVTNNTGVVTEERWKEIMDRTRAMLGQ